VIKLKVQKKDGTTEDFNREKIKAGIVKSGGTAEQAEMIASQIETWASTVAVDGVIKVSDIRIKLLELLGVANPAVKTAFENYKKL
jgi:transcriptional regulator NrdR family protein